MPLQKAHHDPPFRLHSHSVAVEHSSTSAGTAMRILPTNTPARYPVAASRYVRSKTVDRCSWAARSVGGGTLSKVNQVVRIHHLTPRAGRRVTCHRLIRWLTNTTGTMTAGNQMNGK